MSADAVQQAEPMRQEAPYPVELVKLVGHLEYKRGWRFWLANLDRGQGSKGLTLIINITTADSYHPEQQITVNHYMTGLTHPAMGQATTRTWCAS